MQRNGIGPLLISHRYKKLKEKCDGKMKHRAVTELFSQSFTELIHEITISLLTPLTLTLGNSVVKKKKLKIAMILKM